ncbi:MAG TPA: L,D-transpeptidase family protein [Blastocatellia bacterium]|nr:L,D-transpeptidase family protein [Blastocatellia bacterium]
MSERIFRKPTHEANVAQPSGVTTSDGTLIETGSTTLSTRGSEGHIPGAGALMTITLFVVIALAPVANASGRKSRVTPVSPLAGSLAEATATREAELRFSQLGYWLAAVDAKVPNTRLDERRRWALLAFQRVEGRNQTGRLDQAELDALCAAAAPRPRESGYAHVEVDLKRQVLFVVDANSSISLVLPISSGSGKLYTFEGRTSRAVTPRGRFTVYRKIQGYRKAPLGLIYYPCYLVEGVAIHGSPHIPNYPASHGCIRIPMITAKELSDIVPVGTVVLVYDGV